MWLCDVGNVCFLSLCMYILYAIIIKKSVGDSMKKFLCLLFVVIVSLLLLVGCEAYEDEVVLSLGEYKDADYYSCGGIDVNRYNKYYYDDVSLDDNPYFEKLNDDNIEALLKRINHYEEWVEDYASDNELIENYDFDLSLITEDDYVYIYDHDDKEEDQEFRSFDVYFFNTETMILYNFSMNY